MDCEAATAHAKAVLETAYAYSNNVSVLFKPTYASGEETFRPTQDGALAYFVGKTCMDKVYPDKDWSQFAQDGGWFKKKKNVPDFGFIHEMFFARFCFLGGKF